MSITRSYNKHNGIWYAYDTTYIWDETQKKKVQKKKCIGQFDPETGEVIANGGRGRPKKKDVSEEEKTVEPLPINADIDSMQEAMRNISSRLSDIDEMYRALKEAVDSLGEDISRLHEQSET